MAHLSRRRFAMVTGGAIASFAWSSACRAATSEAQERATRLRARPKPNVKTSASGRSRLELGQGRDGVLQVPASGAAGPLPLLVLLHGAGGAGERMLDRLGTTPNDAGVAVLSIDSRGSTWDAIRGGVGPDVAFLDRALEKTFDMVAVDPAKVGIGGFSDGATYALSLGLVNGNLFPRIVAYSPGFVIPGTPQGKPRIFISHGRSDNVLPIERCSRVIVPDLQQRGYDVTFREFDGQHEVPLPIAAEGLRFLKS